VVPLDQAREPPPCPQLTEKTLVEVLVLIDLLLFRFCVRTVDENSPKDSRKRDEECREVMRAFELQPLLQGPGKKHKLDTRFTRVFGPKAWMIVGLFSMKASWTGRVSRARSMERYRGLMLSAKTTFYFRFRYFPPAPPVPPCCNPVALLCFNRVGKEKTQT
jgi:hypothetical protein